MAHAVAGSRVIRSMNSISASTSWLGTVISAWIPSSTVAASPISMGRSTPG